MRALSWEVHGVEPDPAAAAAARVAGIDVVTGTLADASWPDASFDAVTMSSVLEHLHDPGVALGSAFRLLAPGGLLHLVTPNGDALGAERFGTHWRGLEAPRHLVLFNRRSLTKLLAGCGFADPEFPPHFVGECSWIASGASSAASRPTMRARCLARLRARVARGAAWTGARCSAERAESWSPSLDGRVRADDRGPSLSVHHGGVQR